MSSYSKVKLFIVSKMSKVNYQNKVKPIVFAVRVCRSMTGSTCTLVPWWSLPLHWWGSLMSSINIPSMTSNSEWVSENKRLLLLGSEHQWLM